MLKCPYWPRAALLLPTTSSAFPGEFLLVVSYLLLTAHGQWEDISQPLYPFQHGFAQCTSVTSWVPVMALRGGLPAAVTFWKTANTWWTSQLLQDLRHSLLKIKRAQLRAISSACSSFQKTLLFLLYCRWGCFAAAGLGPHAGDAGSCPSLPHVMHFHAINFRGSAAIPVQHLQGFLCPRCQWVLLPANKSCLAMSFQAPSVCKDTARAT